MVTFTYLPKTRQLSIIIPNHKSLISCSYLSFADDEEGVAAGTLSDNVVAFAVESLKHETRDDWNCCGPGAQLFAARAQVNDKSKGYKRVSGIDLHTS
jgi:hypothetical protein